MKTAVALNESAIKKTAIFSPSSSIKVPNYDKRALEPAIVHIGMGHFHRAHFCDYLQNLINSDEIRWGITEIDIMPDVDNICVKLKEQDSYYTLLEKSPKGSEILKIMGPILSYVNASYNLEEALTVLASENTKLITLTITEKGYHYLESNRTLAIDSPPIKHDLKTRENYHTAIGLLSAALWDRYTKNFKQTLIVLSCDNIPSNGFVLKTCVTSFSKIKYPEMIFWLEKYVVFPNSMVDRITPNTKATDIDDLKERYGMNDALAVHCESFKQWIIDDSHRDLLPDFSKVGAIFSSEVEAYEKMKIRLLNGSHSALSYPSYLLGYTKVDEACSDPVIYKFIRRHFMEEITHTLDGPKDFDLSSYKDSLFERFNNRYISDAILRLALDGSKKIHNAIIPPLIESFSIGSPNRAMILSIALWARFLLGYDENNRPLVIEDEQASILTQYAHKALENPDPFLRYIGIHDLKEEHWQELTDTFSYFFVSIISQGVRNTLLHSL